MKRLLLACLLLGATVRAEAADYTGLWFNGPAPKDGYGFNLTQSDDYIFVTFYVFGPDNKPTWYVAGLDWDGVDTYRGKLYFADSGTFFGIPWNKARDYSFNPNGAGTATFKPSATNNYQGTLSYTVTGVGSSTVGIERQTLKEIAWDGNYTGGQSGAYSGCATGSNNYKYVDRFDLTVSPPENGTVTFGFSYVGGLTCNMSGVYELHGQYYSIPNATYTCSDGLNTTAKLTEIKATSLGIEGRFSAPSVGDGCAENAIFSAVYVVP